MPDFHRFETHWLARIGTVDLCVEVQNGKAQPVLLDLADSIVNNLDHYKSMGTRYLDRFVDRQNASGNPETEWWLDQVDIFQTTDGKAPVFALSYSLDGDDGGWWTVKVRSFDHSDHPLEKGQIPFAFSRDQG